jgi:hypothetical protein
MTQTTGRSIYKIAALLGDLEEYHAALFKPRINCILPVFILMNLVACGGSGSIATTTTRAPNQILTVTTVNMMVEEDDVVTLSATVADSAGQISSYVWTQTRGNSSNLLDTDGNAARFNAAQANENSSYGFSIKVSDNDGATATAVLVVSVQDVDGDIRTNIGAAGGTVTSSDGKVTLTIPAGALTEDVAINIHPLSNDVVPNEHLHADLSVTNAYQFSPEGLHFNSPVRVTMPFDNVSEDGSKPMTWLVSGQGECLDTEYELKANVEIEATIQHISADMLHFSRAFNLLHAISAVNVLIVA